VAVGGGFVLAQLLSGNANEPGDGDGGPREGSLSCLTVSRKGTASCLAASFIGSDGLNNTIQHMDTILFSQIHVWGDVLYSCGAETQHNNPGIGSPGERVR